MAYLQPQSQLGAKRKKGLGSNVLQPITLAANIAAWKAAMAGNTAEMHDATRTAAATPHPLPPHPSGPV